MSAYVSSPRFLNVLATVLSRTIIPNLQDAAARAEAENILGIVVRSLLTQTTDPAARRQAARERSEVVRSALKEGRLPAESIDRLIAALDEDEAPRTAAGAASSALFRALGKQEADLFPPPTDGELTACLCRQFPDVPAVHAADISLMSGGNGKQTILFHRADGDGVTDALVMRRDIPQSFNQTTVANEFPLLKALHGRGLAVPEPVWMDGSNSILPTPYLITRRVPGKLAGDGKGAYPGALDNPMEAMADILARLHAVDPHSVDIPGISDQPWDEAALVRTIDGWERYYLESVDTPAVAVDLAFAWLRANVSAGLQAPAIVHGEAGFHNLLAHEGKLTALLDWEMAHIGSPVEDVGYVRGQIELHGSFDDFLDLYVARGGQRPSSAALEFYDIYRLARNAGIFAAGVDSFNKGTTDKLSLVHFSGLLYASYIKKLHKRMRDIVSGGTFHLQNER